MYDKKPKYPPPPPTFLFRSRRHHRSPAPFGAQLPGVELNGDGQIKVNGDGSDEMPASVLNRAAGIQQKTARRDWRSE